MPVLAVLGFLITTRFAFIEFFRSPILVLINRPLAFEAEPLSVRAEQASSVIGNWISGKMSIYFTELLHQWYKAFHV
jgi:hypothetical protein